MASYDSDSDDSDAEGGLGNVTRQIMRPPGHSGKAKRGHLCFDASFETGNLGRVDLITENEFDLFVRPDTCSPRLRLWFNFIVDNVRADQRVIFNIVNLSKSKNLYQNGMTPVVKTTSRPKWVHIVNKNVFYYRSPAHRNHYVLSFAFAFDKEDDVYQFAFGLPYSYSRCQAYLDALQERQMPYFRRELLALSVQKRRVDLVSIGRLDYLSDEPGAPLSSRTPRTVVVIGRSHGGESPSSYVCQGLIDFLISNHPIAVILRDHLIFRIVPMLNPDGVYLGNQRSTLMGFDLNRSWHSISQWAHPTLYALYTAIKQYDQSSTAPLDFVFDFHAHSSLQGVFIYGNTYEDVYRFERHILFPKMLSHNMEDYNTENSLYNREVSKVGTARRYLTHALSESVNCYTLQVSFHGYKRANSSSFCYTEESYKRVGRNFGRTFLDYYRASGLIVLDPPLERPLPGSGGKETRRNRFRSRSRSARGARSRSGPRHSSHFRKSHESVWIQPSSARLGLISDSQRRENVLFRDVTLDQIRTSSHRRINPSPPPTLSIIDFNQLTQGGIDLAVERSTSRHKSPRRTR